jgi:hypothetical protein
MKRLLRKKAEFIDAIEDRKIYIEIYKNPTGREYDSIKEYGDTVRAFLHPNGDIYAWRSDVLHSRMEKLKPEIVSDFRAETDYDGNLQLYLTSNVKTLEQIVELFNAVDFNKIDIKDSAIAALIDTKYYGCQLEEAKYLMGKTIDNIRKINIDELLNSKFDKSVYIEALQQLIDNGYNKVSKYSVTDLQGIYIYYDIETTALYAIGPFMNKIEINPKNLHLEISSLNNVSWQTFMNNIDNNPTIKFNEDYGSFEIKFTDHNGYTGKIFQDAFGIISLVELINPNNEKVLNLFMDNHNNSNEILDPSELIDFINKNL